MKTLNLKYFILKNIRNQFRVLVFFIVILCLIFINSRVSLYNVFFGNFEFDTGAAFNNSNSPEIVFNTMDETGNYAIMIGPTFHDYRQNFKPGTQIVMGKFTQGMKYNFKIKPVDAVYLKRDGNVLKFIDPGRDEYPKIKPDYVLLDTGYSLILSKKINGLKNKIYKGKLLPITPAFIDGTSRIYIPKTLKTRNIFIYELADDVFTTTNEIFDVMLFFIVFSIVAYNVFKLIIYANDYRQHPAYKSLYKLYGKPEELAASIDKDLAVRDKINIYKNRYTAPNWIIEKKIFKTRFSPVHKDY